MLSAWTNERPDALCDDLMIRCSSFPPWQWELMDRAYPNRLLAASSNLDSLHAVALLHELTKPSPQVWTWVTC